MIAKHLSTASLALALCLAACGSSHSEEKTGMKKICFVAGKGSHGKECHAFSAGSKLLASILNKNVTGVNAVVFENGWPDDTSFLDNAAAVVMFCDGLNHHVGNGHWEELDKMAKKGVGIAVLHYAAVVAKGKTGDYFLDWMGGYYEPGWSVNPHWEANFESFPEHPVTRGMKPFTIHDEWYFHMRFREGMNNVTPVLSAHPPASTMKRPDGPHSGNPTVRAAVKNGEIQHVAWVATRPGGGRGFGFTGAHFHKNWQDENFRRLVLNAVAWIANVEIPPDGVPVAIPE
jgi:type 1 glutamine amidotransferase